MASWGLFYLFLSLAHASFFDVTLTETLFGGGEMILPCSIAGEDTICKIDTGLNMTTVPLTPGNAHFLSLGKVSHVSATGSKMSCDIVDLPTMSFQGVEVTALQQVVRCPLPEGAKPIIGMDVLSKQPFSFYYSKSQMALSETEDLFAAHPLRDSESGHLLIDVLVHGKVASRAMFDTGAAVTLVSQKFYEKNKDAFYVIGSSELAKDTQGIMIGTMTALLNWMDLGEKKFVAEYVMIMDFSGLQSFLGEDVDFVLGHNLISNADWSFDTMQKRWQVR